MVFHCLRAVLGAEPDLRSQRLLLDPALPPWLEKIDVRDLRIFDTRISFRVRRHREGDRVAGARGRVTNVRAATPA